MVRRRVNQFSVRLLFAFGLLTFFTGCGSGDQVDVYPTKGTVLFLGEPMMGGGSISFVPLDGQVGKGAGGAIDEEGRFEMTTYDSGDGSMAGNFRVIIMQSTVEEMETSGDTDVEGAEDTSFESTVPEDKQIPFIYADTARSPLTVEIKAEDQNELTLELSK